MGTLQRLDRSCHITYHYITYVSTELSSRPEPLASSFIDSITPFISPINPHIPYRDTQPQTLPLTQFPLALPSLLLQKAALAPPNTQPQQPQ